MQIAIVTYPGMTALDAIGPYEVLRALSGAQIRFVWHDPGPITTDSGVLVLGAAHALLETQAPDIVLVPGSGPATATTANDEVLLAWLRRVHETSTWTTSVCSGSIILAAAGLLEGKSATSHWMTVAGLSAFGANPKRDQRIVREGKIVTAAGVSAGIELALWLVGEIAGEQTARAIQLLIEYDPQPPYDSGHPSKASAAVKREAAAIVAREGAQMLAREPPKPCYGKRPRSRPCSGSARSDEHAPADAGRSRDPSKRHSQLSTIQGPGLAVTAADSVRGRYVLEGKWLGRV